MVVLAFYLIQLFLCTPSYSVVLLCPMVVWGIAMQCNPMNVLLCASLFACVTHYSILFFSKTLFDCTPVSLLHPIEHHCFSLEPGYRIVSDYSLVRYVAPHGSKLCHNVFHEIWLYPVVHVFFTAKPFRAKTNAFGLFEVGTTRKWMGMRIWSSHRPRCFHQWKAFVESILDKRRYATFWGTAFVQMSIKPSQEEYTHDPRLIPGWSRAVNNMARNAGQDWHHIANRKTTRILFLRVVRYRPSWRPQRERRYDFIGWLNYSWLK